MNGKDNTRIKPCPFCGALPKQILRKHPSFINGGYQIQDFKIECSNGECPINPKIVKRTLKEAIKGWNQRKKDEL